MVTFRVGVGSTIAKSNEISFRTLHKECEHDIEIKAPVVKNGKTTAAPTGAKVVALQKPSFCPACDRPVDPSEIVRGYDLGGGRFVTFTDEEIESTKPPGDTKEILINKFVPRNSVTSAMVNEHYFLIPDEHAHRAYALTYQILAKRKLAAVGTEWLFQRKEHPCAIYADQSHSGGGVLMMQVLRLSEDLVPPDFAAPILGKDARSKTELEFAGQVVELMTDDLDPETDLVSKQRDRMNALIETKVAGGVAPVFVREPAEEIDLMEALKRTIEQQKEVS
jgi:DNA end-binding protein Ku